MTLNSREFSAASGRAASDSKQQGLLAYAIGNYTVKRDASRAKFRDWEGARKAAEDVKREALENLDGLLAKFIGKVEGRGGKVFCARDAAEARDYIIGLAEEKGVRSIVKSKSMTTEEIGLNHALEGRGFGVVESDLGEFIIQLRGETPYHIVFPAVHLSRQQVSALFHERLGSPETENPGELTGVARAHLRKVFCSADMGITGANFAVAETGMISVTENEGNARLTMSLPRIHVAVVGIEKIIPRLSDLALLLPVLATNGTGQGMSCYNSFVGGPRRGGECDGPAEFHVVLLDNGRTRILADPDKSEVLRCIRCGGCLGVCPVFRTVGGHAYGTVYPGPIGAVLTPLLRGICEWGHLSFASSLCEACTETCPVRIEIHRLILKNRRDYNRACPSSVQRLAFRAFAFVARRPALFRLAGKAASLGQHFYPLVGWLPFNPLRRWTDTRAMPRVSFTPFRDWWKRRRAGRAE